MIPIPTSRNSSLSNKTYRASTTPISPSASPIPLWPRSRATDLAAHGANLELAIDGRFGAGYFRPASSVFPTGIRPVFRLRTVEGYELRLTGDHRVMTERGWIEAQQLTLGDKLRLINHKG